MLPKHDTIAALATPAGVSSVGIIRVSGPDAFHLVDSVFTGKPLADTPTATARLGQILDDKEVLDQVLCTVFRRPHSYTGEDVLEISGHGSPYILSKLMQLLSRLGIRYAKPGEFTQRAFLNGKLDLAQAEAVADLIEARGERAHQTAMRQLRGGFSQEINVFRERLIDFASLVELELDFSEEDVEFARRDEMEDFVLQLISRLTNLLDSFRTGNAVKHGIATVILGRPNAGKSTLLNRLLGEDRAIVSEIPGTTRDFIEDVMTVHGWQYRFIDTAGLRHTTDTIEAMGVERTLKRLAQADLALYMLDAAQTTPAQLQQELSELGPFPCPLICVGNKAENLHDHPEWPTEAGEVVPISALTGYGMEALLERLARETEASFNTNTSSLITNQRHYDCLLRARAALTDVMQGLHTQLPGDLLAQDIRQALYWLGEITGQITSEDILGNIFGRFCIGK